MKTVYACATATVETHNRRGLISVRACLPTYVHSARWYKIQICKSVDSRSHRNKLLMLCSVLWKIQISHSFDLISLLIFPRNNFCYTNEEREHNLRPFAFDEKFCIENILNSIPRSIRRSYTDDADFVYSFSFLVHIWSGWKLDEKPTLIECNCDVDV